jgi:hypothetical protein
VLVEGGAGGGAASTSWADRTRPLLGALSPGAELFAFTTAGGPSSRM